MPIIYDANDSPKTTVTAVSIDHSLEWYSAKLVLNEDDRKFIHTAHPRKALEFAASRYLLQQMSGLKGHIPCVHDSTGKPYIEGDPREISLSHTEGAVAVAISDQPIGVDVQVFSKKIIRIRNKFIDPKDSPVPVDNLSDRATALAWSAKEAMFKLYAAGEVDFRDHLRLALDNTHEDRGILRGWIEKGDNKREVEVRYAFIKDFTVAYAVYH